MPLRFHFDVHSDANSIHSIVTPTALRSHPNFTFISLRFHLEFTSIHLPCRLDFTYFALHLKSISFRHGFDSTPMWLRVILGFTSRSLWLHFDSKETRIRPHFDFITFSLRSHFDTTPITLLSSPCPDADDSVPLRIIAESFRCSLDLTSFPLRRHSE